MCTTQYEYIYSILSYNNDYYQIIIEVAQLRQHKQRPIDVVHERKDALSLGSVDRNEQHEDHEKPST